MEKTASLWLLCLDSRSSGLGSSACLPCENLTLCIISTVGNLLQVFIQWTILQTSVFSDLAFEGQ